MSGEDKEKAIQEFNISDEEYKKSAEDHGVNLDSQGWEEKKGNKSQLIDEIRKKSLENEKALEENRAALEKLWWRTAGVRHDR
ncbi:hypothetical protein TMatcc_001181 [Talaromyces marneffei ATCC 18224]|uniref:Uncharacterized protein n=2 Tax=Talaromyces marneffei TaxID=37727 RepID=B6QNV3_TALMQ|nr:uncharacterized protein EYB26_003721 [Talaromyces marneffei]EEA21179.1 hypothetical protein PMAA_049770 [Talaromyces marneffei ATCC 18224]KAE8550108.1 hypothetical protein EYB25_008639 [Talaromyces marneffei]QGA16054.1 hypothetical protein EYB26_003721 [Talaromyces marneffei]